MGDVEVCFFDAFAGAEEDGINGSFHGGTIFLNAVLETKYTCRVRRRFKGDWCWG